MLTLKQLLVENGNWYHYRRYYEEHDHIRPAVINSITKILSCKHIARGYAQYCCPDKSCGHSKRVKFSCKDRGCSVCGRTATDKWIAQQKSILPPCSFQHITFTMPSDLWPFFETDRRLINELPKLAANTLKKIASKKGLTPGVFMAIHTFGRKLNWNVHLHTSVTRGGLTKDFQWKSLFFKNKTIMTMWRYAVIRLLRRKMREGMLVLPGHIKACDFNQLLNKQYQKHWKTHCAKPHKNPLKDISYLGRYIKRPPIANARLKHYDGRDVLFGFLNHRNKQKEFLQLPIFDFIERFTKHIPEKSFRMVRYFGFLSNRSRGKLLPIVNKLFDHQPKVVKYSWYFLVKMKSGVNPIECILCKKIMRFSFLTIGLSFAQLRNHHDSLALQKQINIALG